MLSVHEIYILHFKKNRNLGFLFIFIFYPSHIILVGSESDVVHFKLTNFSSRLIFGSGSSIINLNDNFDFVSDVFWFLLTLLFWNHLLSKVSRDVLNFSANYWLVIKTWTMITVNLLWNQNFYAFNMNLLFFLIKIILAHAKISG